MNNEKGTIKCVVWDLDNTLWDGTLLEGDDLKLNNNAIDAIKTLDQRGILQSIASKNEHALALEKLTQLGIDHYFLYPQINWSAKHLSIKKIADALSIGIDSLAFVDDQDFELDEVKFTLPAVTCIRANKIAAIPHLPEMSPRFITQDSAIRRKMYQSDITRKEIEKEFTGSSQEFLASLNMTFKISPATENDLQRAEELTVRTHQLNTTGYTYSYDELKQTIQSDQHILLVAELSDSYGTYGKIGLALIEKHHEAWNIKLLLMSCRVMSRGVGNVMISHILTMAKQQQVRLLAELIPTDRNRIMYMTYKFAGFNEISNKSGLVIFEHDLINIPNIPSYIQYSAA